MKTIISTILTIMVMTYLCSCREQEEDETTAMIRIEIPVNRGMQKNSESSYAVPDSATSRDTINLEGDIILSDPPPKDRDQWRLKD